MSCHANLHSAGVDIAYPSNAWYVAAMSHEIRRELHARTLLGNPVLLYRREDGSVAAIEDRCSHRRVSLSLGKLIGDHVQCGYHGVTFDGSGACVHIPGQERIPPRACVRGYPIVERDGYVWIWMGDKALASERSVPDYSDICSSEKFTGLRANSLRVDAPCLFNIENVLDLSHVSFVHEQTVGTKEVAETKPEITVGDDLIVVHREWDKADSSPLFKKVFGWEKIKRAQTIRFWPGGNVRLDITVEPTGNQDPSLVRHLSVAGPCTPETATTHFKYSAMYRDFELHDAALSKTIADQFHRTVLEDKALMEDQQRNWQADDASGPMFDLAVDRAPLAARRMLQRLWQAEQAERAEQA